MTVPKPIPALYTVYVLRSTIRRSSLYIGSTPNPPRRLKQHNGLSKGGARRTSRDSLRPWEMICIVSGFPSMVAALKFEWAMTNPHSSLHIPTEERLAVSTSRKRNGQPRRPQITLKSVVENMHLLLGVRSFGRWPLNLHFFARDMKKAWDSWLAQSQKTARPGLKILEDYPPTVDEEERVTGIHALPLDYAPLKSYIEKANNLVTFEQEGSCVHCNEVLETGKGLHPMCPNEGCEAMGHLTCWSEKARLSTDREGVLPNLCQCPSCGGELRWGDMMVELSLRTRGEKEVAKLLKKKKGEKKAAA